MTREEFLTLKIGSLIYNSKTLCVRQTVSEFAISCPPEGAGVWTRPPFDSGSHNSLDVSLSSHEDWTRVYFDKLNGVPPEISIQLLSSKIIDLQYKLEELTYKLRSL